MKRNGETEFRKPDAAGRRYCSNGSSKNGFFCPGGAAGWPSASKPVLAATFCAAAALPGAPAAAGTSGAAVIGEGAGPDDALGTAWIAGPGGNSGAPARPQADRPRPATTAAASANWTLTRAKAKGCSTVARATPAT